MKINLYKAAFEGCSFNVDLDNKITVDEKESYGAQKKQEWLELFAILLEQNGDNVLYQYMNILALICMNADSDFYKKYKSINSKNKVIYREKEANPLELAIVSMNWTSKLIKFCKTIEECENGELKKYYEKLHYKLKEKFHDETANIFKTILPLAIETKEEVKNFSKKEDYQDIDYVEKTDDVVFNIVGETTETL